MNESRRAAFTTIFSSLVSAAIGTGFGWKLIEWKYKSQEAEIEKIKTINEFRKDKDKLYEDIFKLLNEYIRTRDEISKTHDTDLIYALNVKIQGMTRHFIIKEGNFDAIEKSLAALEGRKPEHIELGLIAPPTNVRISAD
jgi:hypothetical protein